MTNEQGSLRSLAHAVHSLLLSGLVVSCVLLLLGLALVFWNQEPRPAGIPEAGFKLLRHAAHGEGVAILNLGLLILMLTPALRVTVLVVGWSLERDWLFASIALSVLVLLAISLALGMS